MVRGQHHESGQDAVRHHVIAAMHTRFQRGVRHLGPTLMTHQADTGVSHPKQEGEVRTSTSADQSGLFKA
jgi:hypothetical protein